MQAAFFAHGGFGTWGANVTALGFLGCFFGWGAFRLARLMGLPLWASGFAGGLVGDIMVYVASGLILATTFTNAPSPQYSLTGYLTVIYSAYLPTQLPIALGEMLITGLALHHAYRQREFKKIIYPIVGWVSFLYFLQLPRNPIFYCPAEKEIPWKKNIRR